MRISTIRRFHAAAVAACLAIALPLQAQAQDYPSRPVRLIVPYPVGGASDITARLVADKLSKKWGQGVIVENKAGANGIIGTAEIAKAAPDGYTIGLVASSHVGNPFSYKNVPFDTLNDLQPVTQTATVQLGLVVNPKLGVNNVQELVALLNIYFAEVNKLVQGAMFNIQRMNIRQVAFDALTNSGQLSLIRDPELASELQALDAAIKLARRWEGESVNFTYEFSDPYLISEADTENLMISGIVGDGLSVAWIKGNEAPTLTAEQLKSARFKNLLLYQAEISRGRAHATADCLEQYQKVLDLIRARQSEIGRRP